MTADLPLIQWTPDLSVGISVIDEQHKELLDRVGKFYVGLAQGLDKGKAIQLIGFVRLYVEKLFSEEEAFQASILYPGRDGHLEEHRGFKEKFKKLEMQFFKEGPTEAFLNAFEALVVHWFLNHIRRSDKAFSVWWDENGKNGANPPSGSSLLA